MRWLGAALLAAGCTWLGLRAAGRLAARVALLRSMMGALEWMRRELSLRLTAVPELLEGLEGAALPPADGIFRRFRAQLRAGVRLSQAWGQALEGVPCPPQDRQLLLALGHILGRYDVQGQLDSLAALERALEERLDQAEEERRRLGKVYGMLGVTGGLFLAILLI